MYICSHYFAVNFQTAKLLGSKRVSPTFCLKFRPFKKEFPEINPHSFGATGSNLKRELLLCSFNPIQTRGGFWVSPDQKSWKTSKPFKLNCQGKRHFKVAVMCTLTLTLPWQLRTWRPYFWKLEPPAHFSNQFSFSFELQIRCGFISGKIF